MAATGMYPPLSALPTSTTSGSSPHSSSANQRPVRPRPVWISSATNSVPYRRHGDHAALDRLDDERRDVARAQLGLQPREIAERHARRPGQQGPEALLE